MQQNLFCEERQAVAMAAAALDDYHAYGISAPAVTMIGLTGKRNVGKSTVADMLVEKHGFVKVHAFGAGKAAAYMYFYSITGCDNTAHNMVYGDLKDVPSHYLPGEVSPRLFLEKFGKFMGVDMGVDWTLGMEISIAQRTNPGKSIVVESVVYEADYFKDVLGGKIIRLERPGHDGPEGCETDIAQAGIFANATVSATSVEELLSKAERVVQQMIGGF